MARPKRFSEEGEESEGGSDAEHELENEEEEPQGGGARDGFVSFEEEQEEEKALSGRRLKRKKEMQKKMKTGTFDSMGFSLPVLKAIKRNGYRLPTPIQRKAMPHILQGVDVIGMARTGSGKTAAFVIPLIERLKAHSPKAGARAVLLAPTRELALQTHKAVRDLARYTDLRTAVLVGGDAMEAQFAELALNPDIIVATPGRLLHHLEEVTGLSLRAVEYAVLDEADRLFEMGFMEQIREILNKMGEGRQTLLFSATLPRSLADFASAGLNAPVLVRLDAERRISPDLRLTFLTARADEKMAALLYLVREVIPTNQLTLVFAATRHHVDYIAALMAREGIPAAYAYGTMDQTARKIHVAKFRAQKVHLLITTDVAARGIDIPLIDNIVNLDFPPKPELFVHRVGRAARMGRSGTAYSLLTRDELPYLLDLHLYLGRQLEAAPLTLPAPGQEPPQPAEGVSWYGSIPQAVLGPIIEHVREVDKAASELSGMVRTLSNAYNLYLRTRPAASSESVKRVRQLPQEGVHPMMLAALPPALHGDVTNESALAQFTAALRSFRPSATVLEAEIAGVKSAGALVGGGQQLELGRKNTNDVMQRKRATHAVVIEKERKKKQLQAPAAAAAANSIQGPGTAGTSAQGNGTTHGEEGGESEDDEGAGPDSLRAAREAAVKAAAYGDGVLNEGKYRDKSLYIGHTRDPNKPKDETFQMDEAAAELASAVLDMGAEDAEGMNQQRRQYHWDKRKRKYVQVSGDDARAKGSSKKIRTESGKAIDKDKAGKGIYARWVKSQHQRVAPVGTQEAEDAGPGGSTGLQSQLSRRFDKGHQHKSWKAKGAAPIKGGELKTKVQVSKDRQKKERRKQWLQERQAQKAGKAKEKGQKPKSGGKAKAAAKGGGEKKAGKK